MRSEENGKLESKLNVSVISGGQISKRSDKDEDRSLSFRCTQCVLDSFELNYGPLTSECKAEVLKRPVSFMWKHFFDYWASFLIITPCVISCWRGTWDYANIYLDKVAFKVGGLFSSESVLSFGNVAFTKDCATCRRSPFCCEGAESIQEQKS